MAPTAKSSASKKPARTDDASHPPFGTDDRLLEVHFCCSVESGEAVSADCLLWTISCRLAGEERTLRLADALAGSAGEAPAKADSGKSKAKRATSLPGPSFHTGPVDCVLASRSVHIDLPTLSALLAGDCSPGGTADAVSLHAPPAPSLAQTNPLLDSTQQGTRGVDSTIVSAGTTAAPLPDKLRRSTSTGAGTKAGKRKASGFAESASRGVLLDRIGFSASDVMSVEVHAYPLHLSIPGLTCARIELRCRGGALMPPPVVRRYRPVRFSVHSVDGLPRTMTVSVVMSAMGHRVETPVLPATTSVPAKEDEDGAPVLFSTVRFLCEASPLSAYQRAVMEPVAISVVERNGEAVSATPALVGSGDFSIRALAASGQTYFTESVSLLPVNAAKWSSGAQSCLTAASTVACSLDFFIPLPEVRHVTATGAPAPKGALMTRAVVSMPFAASWVPAAIATLLSQLQQSARATADEDVHLFLEPTPQPVPPPLPGTTGKPAADTGDTKPAKRRGEPPSASSAATAQPNDPGLAGEPAAATLFENASMAVVSPPGVSGFEAADGESRIFCLEGPVSEVHGILLALHGTVVAARGSTDVEEGGFKMLMNSELFTPRRLYTNFPPLVIPPAGAGPTEAQHLSVSPHPVTDVDEVGGGCAGRIHRIRLRESLRSILQQQHYLLRRTLSDACLRCILQLHGLSQCSALRDAVERDLFPSAAAFISLERSFGQTLELADVLGEAAVPTLLNSGQPQRHTATAAAVPAHDASSLTPSHPLLRAPADEPSGAVPWSRQTNSSVGQLYSFQGTVLAHRRRPVPSTVAARFPSAQWMTADDGEEVLCAFSKDAPRGTLRYHMEGQIVMAPGASQLVLYVFDFRTLAKSRTECRNTAYEKSLSTRRREERQLRLLSRRLGGASNGAGRAAAASGQSADASFDGTRLRGGRKSDDSTDDDAGNPPVDTDGLEDTALVSGALPAHSAGDYASPAALRQKAPNGTKSSQLRATAAAAKKEPEMDYEALWNLYDQRAPKEGSTR